MYEMYENVLHLGKLSDFTRFDILGHLGMIPLTNHDVIIYLHLCLRNYNAALHLHTVTHILLLRSARLKCPLFAPCSATLSTPSCPPPGGSWESLWFPAQHEGSEKFKPVSARLPFRSGQKWAHQLDRTVTLLYRENKTGVNHPCCGYQRSPDALSRKSSMMQHEFLSQWKDYVEQ
jgi:hypothetical protein